MVSMTTSDLETTTSINSVDNYEGEDTTRLPALICICGRSIGQMFVLHRKEVLIGRAPECEIFLDDQGVSRHHAKIVGDNNHRVLFDLESTNGTFHKGHLIKKHVLRDGEQIRLGSSTILQFRFQDEREAKFHSLVQAFKIRDPLTGALNRRAFVTELEKEFGFARRHNLPLSVLMLDLDHFRCVNDKYGHSVGDLILQRVAESIRRSIRKEDIFARYGGESLRYFCEIRI